MPGGYGTSGPWGSSGDTYGNKPSAPPGRDPGGHHFGGGNQDNQNNQVNQESQAAQAASQALHAQQMQEMARGMQAAGQISGGLSGGTYTKGPVKYPKHWYTDEGLAEVRNRGWSDKLKPQFGFEGEYSILGNEAYTEAQMDKYGRFQTLPEGMVYSTNIGDPQRGWGGFRRVSNFTDGYNDQGGGYSGWGSGGGGGGSGGGGGGYPPPEKPQFPGQRGEQWGSQNPLQQAMVDIHGAGKFQQGFARGGIVSLVA
jgi:hypothetical protein